MNFIVSPLVGTVVAVKVRVGDTVDADTELVIIESMKMEHPVRAGNHQRSVGGCRRNSR